MCGTPKDDRLRRAFVHPALNRVGNFYYVAPLADKTVRRAVTGDKCRREPTARAGVVNSWNRSQIIAAFINKEMVSHRRPGHPRPFIQSNLQRSKLAAPELLDEAESRKNCGNSSPTVLWWGSWASVIRDVICKSDNQKTSLRKSKGRTIETEKVTVKGKRINVKLDPEKNKKREIRSRDPRPLAVTRLGPPSRASAADRPPSDTQKYGPFVMRRINSMKYRNCRSPAVSPVYFVS
ncbi:hypothetical protein EVAR_96166_1 [Eumeta japonica]|uniref:Uncharacterized protein n=1 Tax=Eumeta variegata TaxID=151549 RepID=A0A4C1VL24_EUMVA|nr:hypothetical protein EVAR_96166_1 [Eumeta japonica]